jgi:hypothetical protein
MQRILEKHKSQFFSMRRLKNNKTNNNTMTDNDNHNTTENRNNNNNYNDPKKQIVVYVIIKIIKYQCNKYPADLFIVLEDATSSELISKNESLII